MQGETLSSNTETISLPLYGDEAVNSSFHKKVQLKPLKTMGERMKRLTPLEKGRIRADETMRKLG